MGHFCFISFQIVGWSRRVPIIVISNLRHLLVLLRSFDEYDSKSIYFALFTRICFFMNLCGKKCFVGLGIDGSYTYSFDLEARIRICLTRFHLDLFCIKASFELNQYCCLFLPLSYYNYALVSHRYWISLIERRSREVSIVFHHIFFHL